MSCLVCIWIIISGLPLKVVSLGSVIWMHFVSVSFSFGPCFLQQYIHSLEASLQEEMSRHAPLYGAGLEALSMKELETLSRIHEEGLRQIHVLQQRKGSLVSSHTIPHNHGLYPTTAPPMAVGLPPSLIPNGVGIHGNGHVNGAVGPWFNHTWFSRATCSFVPMHLLTP